MRNNCQNSTICPAESYKIWQIVPKRSRVFLAGGLVESVSGKPCIERGVCVCYEYETQYRIYSNGEKVIRIDYVKFSSFKALVFLSSCFFHGSSFPFNKKKQTAPWCDIDVVLLGASGRTYSFLCTGTCCLWDLQIFGCNMNRVYSPLTSCIPFPAKCSGGSERAETVETDLGFNWLYYSSQFIQHLIMRIV